MMNHVLDGTGPSLIVVTDSLRPFSAAMHGHFLAATDDTRGFRTRECKRGGLAGALGNGLVHQAFKPKHDLVADIGGNAHEEAPGESGLAHRRDVELGLVRVIVVPPVGRRQCLGL